MQAESQRRWARRGDNMNLVFRGTHESQAWPGPWQPLTPLCCAVPKKAGAAGSPGVTHAHTHLLADEGAQGDVLQGPHAPAHVLRPVELQPCPGKQGEPLTPSSQTLSSHSDYTPALELPVQGSPQHILRERGIALECRPTAAFVCRQM